MLNVVELDNTKYPAGPATVVANVASVTEDQRFGADRDGARNPALRLWGGPALPVGSRCSLEGKP